jgi:hypothetical protein
MAGVLVGHHRVHRAHLAVQFDGSQEFGDIAHLVREPLRGALVNRVAGQQLAVFLEHGAAAGGIAEDGVEAAAAEGVDIAAGQRARVAGKAGMQMQRAAAALPGGDHHFATVALQHAHAGLMQAGERNVGDAAGEESHPVAAHAFGRECFADLRKKERRVGWRSELCTTPPTRPSIRIRPRPRARSSVR